MSTRRRVLIILAERVVFLVLGGFFDVVVGVGGWSLELRFMRCLCLRGSYGCNSSHVCYLWIATRGPEEAVESL